MLNCFCWHMGGLPSLTSAASEWSIYLTICEEQETLPADIAPSSHRRRSALVRRASLFTMFGTILAIILSWCDNQQYIAF